jgi:hypothetical protein
MSANMWGTPKQYYIPVRLPDGTYEVRRMWQSRMSWDVVATATNEARAKMLAYTYGEGQ